MSAAGDQEGRIGRDSVGSGDWPVIERDKCDQQAGGDRVHGEKHVVCTATPQPPLLRGERPVSSSLKSQVSSLNPISTRLCNFCRLHARANSPCLALAFSIFSRPPQDRGPASVHIFGGPLSRHCQPSGNHHL